MAPNNVPLPMFPGFSGIGLLSPQVIEIATVFNAEGVSALSGIPDRLVAWADVCTRVTPGVNLGQAKIPVRLTSLLGFMPFTGDRKYHPLTMSAVAVRVNAWDLNLEWPIQFMQPGAPAQLSEFYGVSGLAGDVVEQARALKADMAASVIIKGMTNAALGMTAEAFTLPQPGAPNGLPLFHTAHYANPMDGNSRTFSNLTLGAGKITAPGVFDTCQMDMTQVPHPAKPNIPLGIQVTDIVGPTRMLKHFYKLALQSLSLETTTTPAALAAATTNVWNPELMAAAMSKVGVSGFAPWRFWIAPQLDAHPYLLNNDLQMWLTLSGSKSSASYIEMAAPQKEMTPNIRLLGDNTENAIKTRKVQMIADIDAGAAAGLPHFAHLYLETTPSAG